MAIKNKIGKKGETEPEFEVGEWGDTLAVDEPAERKKTPASRVLLLLLLLVVTAGAGYVYFIGMAEEEAPLPPPARQASPVKQPIAIPVPPAEPLAEKASASATADVPPAENASAPATADASQVEKQLTVSTAVQAVQETAPSAIPLPTAAAVPHPAAVAETFPAADLATPAAKQSVEPPARSAAPAGKYILDAGTFLLRENRLQAERTIRRLGFQPQAVTVKRPTEMVRLQLGVYSGVEAKERLQDLAAVAPDAFMLPQGDQVAVYAGSFFDLDKARTFADWLYELGFRVEEVAAQVPMTLQRVTFGSFVDQASADEAAKKALAAGLQVTVARKK